MWSQLLVLAGALLLLPAQALAGAKEKLAALAPSGVVLVLDEKGNEVVAQNALKTMTRKVSAAGSMVPVVLFRARTETVFAAETQAW